jgi:hypothetical protein
MRKLSQYQLRKINKNLDFFFNSATKKDIKNGLDWYKDANLQAQKISKKYDIDVYKVSQVISALSPRNKWSQNLKDADKVCEAYKLGLHPTDVKVCTFHTNKFKAFNILNNNVNITTKSLKTFNFVNNIAFLDNDSLTVDIWHLRACFKDSIKIDSAQIGKLAYQQIKKLTIKKANKLGLKGFEFQAILWLSTQRYFNNLNK